MNFYQGDTKTLTKASLKNEPTLTILKFGADWCGPCKAYEPIFDEVINESNKEVKAYSLNVDNSRDLCTEYGIRGVPSTLFVKNGEVVNMLVGNTKKGDLVKALEKSMLE